MPMFVFVAYGYFSTARFKKKKKLLGRERPAWIVVSSENRLIFHTLAAELHCPVDLTNKQLSEAPEPGNVPAGSGARVRVPWEKKKKKSRRTPSQRPRPSSFGARQSGVWSELPGLRNRIAPAPPTSGERPWKCLRRLAAQDLADGEQPVLSLILFLFNFPCFVTHCVNAARLPGVRCGVNWSLSHFEMIRH